ncbi:3-deoxy-D-manno-octulosonic acid transferase [Pararhodospirillum photometricum]|nr:3-deoxy-D-manno-octulosonic acid transferase [Pararhodospirillum photometricum]
MPTLALYRLLTAASAPGIDAFLRRRLARGKEDPVRLGERQGIAGLPRPEGPLVWLHGASLGEAAALLPLMARLRTERPALHLLLTTGTVSSARVLAERLPEGAVHQFVPVDTPAAARRFLEHWRPDLILWSESDLWPNLLAEADRLGVPRVLLNGRLSARSHRAWALARPLVTRMLGGFALALGQTEADAQRLADLGAPRTAQLGNLKQAAPAPEVDLPALAEAQAALGARPTWLFASTHPGEEEVAARVHRALKARHPDLLTLVVPRHAERAPALAEALSAQGLRVGRRSQGWPAADTEIWLGDTMGEMGLYLRLAPLVVMGKTFPESGSRLGGQNPLEPAMLERAVLWGPGMTNFAEIAQTMIAHGAARAVADADELTLALDIFLTHPEQARAQASAARRWAEGERAVLDRVLAALAPFLDPLAPPLPCLDEVPGAHP